MKNSSENFCERRTILERILIVFVVILLCFVLALFIVLILQYGRLFKFNSSSEICTSPGCIKAAALIIDFIDPTINPCDNFYDFVCGNFLKISLETREITALSKLESVKNTQLNSIITEPTTKPLPRLLELQRQFYRTCMNTTSFEEEDNRNALSNLLAKLGGWPVVHGRFWNARKFNWLDFMVQSRNIGVKHNFFLDFSVPEDLNPTKIMLLSIAPPKPVYLEESERKPYLKVMMDIAEKEFQAPKEQIGFEFETVLRFQDDLNKIIEDAAEHENSTAVAVKELQQKFPNIAWIAFINNMTKTAEPFNESSFVLFSAERYLRNFTQLLSKTPKKTQANYLIWKIVEDFRSFLSEKARQSFDLNLDIMFPGKNSRKRYCLYHAKEYFPSVAELAYIHKYMSAEKKIDIQEMVSRVKKQIRHQAEEATWIDQQTKTDAFNLLHETTEVIGFSEDGILENFEKLTDMEGFKFKSDYIIDMIIQLNLNLEDNNCKLINRNYTELMRLVFEKYPTMNINAFYAPNVNILILPAPFLQGVIYDFHRPRYMNYGGAGSVIGHELTHAFTTQGNDSTSEYEIETWWQPETVQNYKERTSCLVDQYDNYHSHLDGYTQKGSEALNENVADFNGPNVAYKAYQEWVKDHGQEPRLPGLDYTPNQIFWMMFGAFKCYQPQLWEGDEDNDTEHGVPSFGVSGSMMNSPYFARDYNCPIGSKMNPVEKCIILPV